MEKKTTGLKNYIITIIIALIIGAMVIIYESGYLPFSENAARLFCDGFFISGILVFLFGLLAFVANEGGFFAFSYAGKKIKEKFSKEKSSEKQSYFDYVQEKKALGKRSVAHMLVVGAALILIAVAIMLIFNLM